MNNYSAKKSLIKSVKYPLIIILGFVIAGFIGEFPDIANMTVGAVLIFLYDLLKRKVWSRLP